MKKAVILGERQGGVVDAPDPKPVENWVMVKVHTAPMCTEYKNFLSGKPNVSLGHEASGEVVDVAQPCRVKPGDRVVVMPQYPCGVCPLCVQGEYIHCQHLVNVEAFTGSPEGRATMAQFLLKPDWLLPQIPDGVSYDHGALACCGLGPTFGAFERMGVEVFDTVLITGLGPVGLGGIINAKHRGARVIAVESHPYRSQLAKDIGADVVINPKDADVLKQILDVTHGVGVDKAVDCSGVVSAHRLCIDAVRRRGQVAFVGECSDETPIKISPDMIRKGIVLIGSWHYNLKDVPKLMQVVQKNGTKLDRLISHRFSLSQVQDAWTLQATGNCAKVLLKPWEGVL
jgi:L-iditol 2-dehydrogenase